ncbi:MAG: hypothetical protein KKH94_06580 [Candidatus Omnitrophica bacterium]|nr:hypothetical protein [Candidatus Omnitrophota bacterium]
MNDIFIHHRQLHSRKHPDVFEDWLNDKCVYVTSHTVLRTVSQQNQELVFDWLLER